MQLTFLGGADEVGASSTLIKIGGQRVLVDAGIRISPRTSRGISNDQLPDLYPVSEAGGPDIILVTHAHTDHTGALPLVVEQYPEVPVLATRATIELVRILQADAQRIMQSRQEQEGELPLFDEVAVERLLQAFQPVAFRQPVRLGSDLQVTFYPSGHIAGAALVVLESSDGVLVMSGDLSLTDQRAVVSAQLPNIKADALVMESTYGGKLHANRVAEEKRLVDTLCQITEQGGKALIPAFALGRAQEVLQILLAYRDRLAVPVYVDGMVRAVCRAYHTFADELPPATTRLAGTEALFFRKNIHPVQNAGQREQIAREADPAVIVASSGMLTGGASVVYAKHMAGETQNAILLTGYQDEEAPGRFLQNILNRHIAGESIKLRLGDGEVAVRCALGTYALSAHADEAELITIADALDADHILLVHGNAEARHSVATKLRQRQKQVQTPQSGQTVSLTFAARPWAMGQIKAGTETQPFAAASLWERLKEQAGDFYSASEMARMWWGDGERAADILQHLSQDPIYFARDWRRQDLFRVRTPQQVQTSQRCRTRMLAYPDLVGQLVVLRTRSGKIRVGVVTGASADGFEARVHNGKGTHYAADALIWVIAPWRDFPVDQAAGRRRLGDVVRAAQKLGGSLVPQPVRQKLADAGEPIDPANLVPASLPEGVTSEIAQLAIVLLLAKEGAVWHAAGLIPSTAQASERMEMNQTRQTALTLFPDAAGLYKVGMDTPQGQMTLYFDFPALAEAHYGEQIEALGDHTGWEVVIHPQVKQQALGLVLEELLPVGAQVRKGPSYYMDRYEVQIEVDLPGDVTSIEQLYLDRTGFRLIINRPGEPLLAQGEQMAVPDSGQQMEINAAYGLIRAALEPHGLYKTSLKQGQIVLSFISPQVGERHQAIIQTLVEQTGYAMAVHPHPNQQQILQITQQVLHETGWGLRKAPGLRVDRGEIVVSLTTPPLPSLQEKVNAELVDLTGYRLVLK